MNTTKIVEIISKSKFKDMIKKREHNIILSPHSLFHLNDSQREEYNKDYFEKVLLTETPYSVGLQKNKRIASFYKRKKGFFKLILNIQKDKAEVVTFINTEKIPDIRRLKK